jgi:hypothetical protein
LPTAGRQPSWQVAKTFTKRRQPKFKCYGWWTLGWVKYALVVAYEALPQPSLRPGGRSCGGKKPSFLDSVHGLKQYWSRRSGIRTVRLLRHRRHVAIPAEDDYKNGVCTMFWFMSNPQSRLTRRFQLPSFHSCCTYSPQNRPCGQ